MEEKENDAGPIPKGSDSPSSTAKSCALCGCSTPAVRCDRCSSQIFCLSCDDVYHRHPKRRLHLRKAVDSIWNSSRSPRLRRRTDLPGDPSKIPIPPPRTKKRERHTIGGRMFFNSNLELGSFAHSKMFDLKSFSPVTKEFTGGRKSPGTLEPNYENDANIQAMRNINVPGRNEIYENDNIANNQDKIIDNSSDMERSPWNVSRPNISSPIQVSIPSSSPDVMTNGQSFGFPGKPQSHSVADLPGAASNQVGPHPYHFPHNYPYMHPPIHPPYSHSMAHLNCAQCLSSSWSNLMSPHPSPYFHPMPWGSAQSTLTRGHPTQGPHGHIKHSHGDLVSYTDSNFHYPYPGGAFYPNVPPVVDPNFIKDLHQQAEMQRMRKSPTNSRQEQSNEEANTVAEPVTDENRIADGSVTETASQQEVQAEDAEPKVPEKPTKPWSCVHCTFINPPGIYICQVCCKTSYGTKTSESQETSEVSPVDNRDSESPMELVNRDAEASSEFSEYREAQKVI